LTTMNKTQFVREASRTLLNAKAVEDGDHPLDVAQRKTLQSATEEWLKQLYEKLDADGFYIGRRGVKY